MITAKRIFLQIIVTCKSIPNNDWRSFIQYAIREEMMVYEIRGYGSDPAAAATDAWTKFQSCPEKWDDKWEWT